MQSLIQQILDKDPAATLTARELGRQANPELIKLTRHAEAKVRRIAVYCLDETGGPDAARTFTRLVLDEDPQVRGAALQGLSNHPGDVDAGDLLEAYDHSGDGYVRQQLMIVAVRVPQVTQFEIEKRYEAETRPDAKEGLLVALASRGHSGAQADFQRALEASRGKDRARMLEYARQIKGPWLLPSLRTILDDETPLVRIGVDGMPDLPEHLRACDIAVNLIAQITSKTFSFKVAGNVNYSVAQRAEVKATIK